MTARQNETVSIIVSTLFLLHSVNSPVDGVGPVVGVGVGGGGSVVIGCGGGRQHIPHIPPHDLQRFDCLYS
jgi:hypothetical protein